MTGDFAIELRPTEISDLEKFFVFQLDNDACYLAAFTPKNPTDKEAYLQKYTQLLQNPTVHMKTVFIDGIIAGSISKFEMEGDAEITYWFDKRFWGKGVASKVLEKFLTLEKARPLYGRVAFDNFGSQKVLERSGFVKVGTDKGFANARQAEIEEIIYQLA